MTTKRILILEDEPSSAERLIRLLALHAPELQVVAQLDSVTSAWTFLQQNPHPDLAFFDIQLADSLSFDLFERTQLNFPIVFVTAYDEYALRAFRVNSVDYLLKPLDESDLLRCLDKLRKYYYRAPELGHVNLDIQQAIKDYFASKRYRDRFMIHTKDGYRSISVNNIAWLHSEHKLVRIMLTDGTRVTLDEPLESVVSQLDPHLFFQANRQFVVALSAIQSVHRFFGHRLQLKLKPASPDEVLISKEKAAEFRRWFDGRN